MTDNRTVVRMDAYERITRNAAEVVTEEEIEALADDPDGKRAYVGYEPSGVLHIGHMLTANKLIDLQEAGFEVTVLLADVHAYLNDKGRSRRSDTPQSACATSSSRTGSTSRTRSSCSAPTSSSTTITRWTSTP